MISETINTGVLHQAGKNRSEREFSVGELVYLKLQPYVQSSIAPRNNQKLAYRFFGPFQILARVGSVAYKLDLPSHSKIHPIIHVSQLKKHIPPQTEVSKDLTNAIINDTKVALPIAVLEHKLVKQAGSVHPRIRVQWSGMSSALATWEDEADLRRRFSSAPAWGHAGFKGGRSVRTQV